MHKLACILNETGWSRHTAWQGYGEDGHIIYSFDNQKKNEYWNEASALFETLISNADDSNIKINSIFNLIMLYRNTGENKKAISLSNSLPEIKYSREVMLATSTDGKEQAGYLGEALLELAYEFAEQLVYALVNDKSHFDTDLPIKKIKGAISLFDLICDDGNMGIYHREVCYLYLYLSRLQYEKGYKDEAFESLDTSLKHAQAYDKFVLCENPTYTASLLKYSKCKKESFSLSGSLAKNLPNDWPMWLNPDYSRVKEEIIEDKRWKLWVEKTSE